MTDSYPGDLPPVPPASPYAAPNAAPGSLPPVPPAYAPPPRQPSSGLAIAALVVGIVAFLLGWMPILGIILGAVGIVLGIIAVRRPAGKALSITGLVLSGIAILASILMTVLVFVIVPLADRDEGTTLEIDGESEAPPRLETQLIDTPCYTFEGPKGYINDVSTDTAEGCTTELELWGELQDDGTVKNTGVGAVHASVTVEAVRASTVAGWGTDGTLDGVQSYLDQEFIPAMGSPIGDRETVSLGATEGYLTRVDSTVAETTTKALLVSVASDGYDTPKGDVEVFVISFVTVEDNGDAIIATLLDTWQWK